MGAFIGFIPTKIVGLPARLQRGKPQAGILKTLQG